MVFEISKSIHLIKYLNIVSGNQDPFVYEFFLFYICLFVKKNLFSYNLHFEVNII